MKKIWIALVLLCFSVLPAYATEVKGVEATRQGLVDSVAKAENWCEKSKKLKQGRIVTVRWEYDKQGRCVPPKKVK